MYTTFEEEERKSLLDGRSLRVLEYDKIRSILTTKAKSAGGKELCESLLPTSDVKLAELRQKETDDAVRYLLSQGQLPLSGLFDIRPSISMAAAGARLTQKALLSVAAFLRASERVLSVAHEVEAKADDELFIRIRAVRPIPKLEKDISFCILSEEEINDRASDELYRLRRKIRELQGKVRDTLDSIIRNHASALQEQLVTLRGERYVVPVKSEKRGEIPGIVHDTSSSGQTVFIEPMAVVEANNRIRELLSEEKEEIEKILARLSDEVAQHADLLEQDFHLLSEIDFLSAKANLSIQMRGSRPILNDEGRIHLRKARHPLIPKERVVPIDFMIGSQYRTLVITGPNTGGKTVSLKTCGLFSLMAMAGLQIPALDHSEVSVFRRVLADIGDEQSIEQSLSTFSSHMRNLVEILHEAGDSSLVLVDELGSGTDPSEGAALAIAILDHLRRQGAVTVATTHYKELKGYAIETEGVENACCEFDADTLSPTYRLLIGLPGVSNAFLISRKLGLPDDIISSAQTLLSEEGLRFEELLSSAEQNNRESEKLKKEIREIRDHAREQEELLRKERELTEAKRAAILAQAREEKRELLDEALEEADRLLRELRLAEKEKNKRDSEEKIQRIRQNLRAGLSDLSAETKTQGPASHPGEKPDEVRVGGFYYAPSFDVVGTVVKGPDNRGVCVLQAGSMRVNVKAADLRIPDEQAIKEKTKPSKKGNARSAPNPPIYGSTTRTNKSSTILPEIQLLGMTVDEAIPVLDRYLDDCTLSGMATVRIVHGKGTGALRSAVSQFLRQDPRVRRFRLGTFGEGEDGVTIAEL